VRDYRPFGTPVPVTADDIAVGVDRITADGSLLDRDGHYVTTAPDDFDY
jgi:hypothetical protein